MIENKPDTFLTPEDLCRILGLGRNSVYTLLKDGSIKSCRFRRKIKISRADLDQYIKNQYQKKPSNKTANDS